MKKIICTIGAIALSACALQPSVTSQNPANVTFQFKNAQNESVLTFWRKINENGTKGDRFSVGIPQSTGLLNLDFPEYSPEFVELDPGTYFLDSFQVPVNTTGAKYCLSESGHYLLRNGWDAENQKPLYMSFTVREKQNLELPVVTFNNDCAASFNDSEKVLTVGDKLKRK